MTDPLVFDCKQRGHIYLWTYTENKRNFSGWHLHVDEEAGAFLLELFHLMMVAKWTPFKDLKLSKPTKEVLRIPNNGRSRFFYIEKLRIKYPKGKIVPSHWNMEVSGKEMELVVGLDKLKVLKQGIKDILEYRNDYSITHENGQRLWFW